MNRLKTLLAVPVLAGGLMFGTAACGDPCGGLSASAQDREAANNGYEVEREGDYGNECELQPNGSWEVDD